MTNHFYMVKDKEYLKRFRYLGKEKYRRMWEANNYGNYSQMHIARIVNYYETLEYLKGSTVAKKRTHQEGASKKKDETIKPKLIYTDNETAEMLKELSVLLKATKVRVVKSLVTMVHEFYIQKNKNKNSY